GRRGREEQVGKGWAMAAPPKRIPVENGSAKNGGWDSEQGQEGEDSDEAAGKARVPDGFATDTVGDNATRDGEQHRYSVRNHQNQQGGLGRHSGFLREVAQPEDRDKIEADRRSSPGKQQQEHGAWVCSENPQTADRSLL